MREWPKFCACWIARVAVCAGMWAAAPEAEAATVSWVKPVGAWSDTNSWSGTRVPTSADTALINNGGTAMATGGLSGSYQTLTLGSGSGQAGNVVIAGSNLMGSTANIGAGANGGGAVTVQSGTWSNAAMNIGLSGSGTLTLNGGLVSDSNGYIGRNVGGRGVVSVNGGTWANTNALYVGVPDGGGGYGLLNLTNGLVSSQNSYIRSGTVGVTGGTLATQQSLSVGGYTGTGMLKVDGGSVSAVTVFVGGSVSAARGLATVSGGTLQSTFLTVGGSGGALTIDGGYLATPFVTLGDSRAVPGLSTVTMNGGTWSGTRQFLVDTATLNINGGYLFTGSAAVAVGTVDSGSGGGVVNVTGGTWQNAQSLQVGYYNRGTLNISGGSVSTASANVGSLAYFSNTGSALATITGGTWNTTNELTVGGGILSIGGGYVYAGTASIGYNMSGTVLMNSGRWEVGDDLKIGRYSNSGLVVINGGHVSDADAFVGNGSGGFALTGTATINGGTWNSSNSLTVEAALLNINGGLVTANSSTIKPSTSFNSGTVVVAGGTWQTAQTLQVDGALAIRGGYVTAQDSAVGTFGGGVVTVSGGTWNTTSLTFGQGGGVGISGGLVNVSGTVNVDGFGSYPLLSITGSSNGTAGVLAASRIVSTYSLNILGIDGGTLRALGDESDFISSAIPISPYGSVVVGENGAFIDTNGYSIGIKAGFTFSGAPIGGLTKLGEGTLTLSGTSGYWGATTVRSGTLVVGAGGKISSTSGVTVSDTYGQSAALVISGTVLSKNGIVGGGTNATGMAVVTGSTARWQSSGTLAVGASGTGSLSITNGATVVSGVGYVGAKNSRPGVVTVDGGRWNSASLTVGGGDAGVLTITDGVVSVSNGVTLASSGTVTVSGDATHQGILEAAKITSASGGGVLNVSGGILRAMRDEGKNFLEGFAGKNMTIGTGGLVMDTNGYSVTIAAPLSGTGGLKVQGGGLLALSGTNTYLGGTRVASGTLQLGSGGTSGTVAGNIDDDGEVSFNRSDTFTYSGVISGSGAVRQAGSGTTIFTGGNAHTGGTFVDAGTLQVGNGATVGSIVGDVVTNATLAFNRSDTLTFGGIISGTGGVRQMGAGTLVLTGSNTYSGRTQIEAGGVELGDGGSIAGDVVNESVLAFAHSDELTYGGAISGAGQVQQVGSGTVILTGSHSYTGGTEVVTGGLQIGNGGTTGSITGDVRVGGVLAFDRSDGVTFAGDISGQGQLRQIGTGTTTLTGGVGLTGGTVISAGTLQIGNGGTTGRISGSVANDGVLAFQRRDSVSLDNPISGSGQLWQIGTGTMILAAKNTYVGGTVIRAGTLQIGGGGGSGEISGAVSNDGVLAFNRSGTVSFGGVISGSGVVRQMSAGTLVLTGSNAYTGGTDVAAGRLLVAGDNSQSTGAVTVRGGAILGGTGVVGGDVVVQGGGTLAPGTNVGLFTTLGGLTMEAGSTLAMEVSGTGSFDQIFVGGEFVAGGTLSLNLGYMAAAGNAFRIFTNGGYDSGSFNIVSNLGSGLVWNTDALAASGVISISNLLTWGNAISGTWQGTANWGGGVPSSVSVATINNSGTVMLVTGTGSYGKLLVGASTGGAGTISVTGGMLTGSSAVLGSNAGSRGVALVSNGTWNDVSSLIVGDSGTGTLSLTDKGLVLVGGGSGTLTLAQNAGSVGTLNLGAGKAAGTLRVAEVAGGDGMGVVNFNHSDAYVFAPRLTGAVALNKLGKGVLSLIGANTHTGGTTISEGTLQIGSGSTTGSIAGDILNRATLAFNRSNTMTYGGVISGTGKVVKLGSGTTILTGTNTYTGLTTVTAGTLQIGDSGTTGSVAGPVQTDAMLAFNRSDNVVMGGVISGKGSLRQDGTGVLALTGSNTFSGTAIVTRGTLQIGNGGTTGGIAGKTVANGGTLAFNRSDVLTFASVVSGTGRVVQRGTGTTVLAGANTYTGGTVVEQGTLQIGNDKGGSILGDVLNNAALSFGASKGAFGGVISGTGRLVQNNAKGVTILTGENTYTGGTFVDAGVLQIGNGLTGSIVGDVANRGTLAFGRTNTLTYGGVISGTGKVLQSGVGTTILTGNNTYTGGTTISFGKLQIGNGGTSGAIVGPVVNNAALAFNRSDSFTFAGAISGKGRVVQEGTGTTVLKGANSHTGGTYLEDGTLEIGSATALGKGPLMLDGGVLATDGTINKIAVTGNLLWDSDAEIALTLRGDATSEYVAVTGKLTLTGDGKFTFVLTGDALPESGSYLVMTVAGGFKGVTADSFTFKSESGDLTGAFRIAGTQLFFDETAASASLRMGARSMGLESSPTVGVVPEPSTWVLLVLGAAALVVWRRRKVAVDRE